MLTLSLWMESLSLVNRAWASILIASLAMALILTAALIALERCGADVPRWAIRLNWLAAVVLFACVEVELLFSLL